MSKKHHVYTTYAKNEKRTFEQASRRESRKYRTGERFRKCSCSARTSASPPASVSANWPPSIRESSRLQRNRNGVDRRLKAYSNFSRATYICIRVHTHMYIHIYPHARTCIRLPIRFTIPSSGGRQHDNATAIRVARRFPISGYERTAIKINVVYDGHLFISLLRFSNVERPLVRLRVRATF